MQNTIFVAGHNGMVGAAILKRLRIKNDCALITKSREELDLSNQEAVKQFFSTQHIDQVYLCAAKVGGIYANNQYPAEFIYQNLCIQSNVIHQAYCNGVKKLLFLGSSCIYPKHAKQPIAEAELLNGPLEPTNEPYATAKIAGIKLCESYNRQYNVDYRSVMPTNLYGENDNFHPEHSHVIPALLRRFHEAKINKLPSLIIWGSGNAKREFLHVDDMAEASIYLMNIEQDRLRQQVPNTQSHINLGSGKECSITELAQLIANTVDYRGKIEFDASKPDGAPRKLLDISLAKSLGWQAKTQLRDGITETYQWFLKNQHRYRSQ
jgi:GDP-L-fucose synthase